MRSIIAEMVGMAMEYFGSVVEKRLWISLWISCGYLFGMYWNDLNY
jgi:hypothetical protein